MSVSESVIATLICMVAFLSGFNLSENDWEKQAIEHGAAEWRIDPTTGDKSFVWLTVGGGE